MSYDFTRTVVATGKYKELAEQLGRSGQASIALGHRIVIEASSEEDAKKFAFDSMVAEAYYLGQEFELSDVESYPIYHQTTGEAIGWHIEVPDNWNDNHYYRDDEY